MYSAVPYRAVVFNMLMHNLQHANIVSVPTMMNACSCTACAAIVFFPELSRQLQIRRLPSNMHNRT